MGHPWLRAGERQHAGPDVCLRACCAVTSDASPCRHRGAARQRPAVTASGIAQPGAATASGRHAVGAWRLDLAGDRTCWAEGQSDFRTDLRPWEIESVRCRLGTRLPHGLAAVASGGNGTGLSSAPRGAGDADWIDTSSPMSVLCAKGSGAGLSAVLRAWQLAGLARRFGRGLSQRQHLDQPYVRGPAKAGLRSAPIVNRRGLGSLWVQRERPASVHARQRLDHPSDRFCPKGPCACQLEIQGRLGYMWRFGNRFAARSRTHVRHVVVYALHQSCCPPV